MPRGRPDQPRDPRWCYGCPPPGVEAGSEPALRKRIELAELRVDDALGIRWAPGVEGWPALAESWQRTLNDARAELARLQRKPETKRATEREEATA